MNRSTFLQSLLALVAAPFVHAFRKKDKPEYIHVDGWGEITECTFNSVPTKNIMYANGRWWEIVDGNMACSPLQEDWQDGTTVTFSNPNNLHS